MDFERDRELLAQATTTEEPSSSGGGSLQAIGDLFTQPAMLGMFGLLAVVLVLNALQGGNNDLASARWAKGGDKRRARKRARKQIASGKANDACLWIGQSPEKSGLFRSSGIAVPDANQSAAILGRPKSGKTFSAIDPMVRSAIEQGMSVVLYDYKADDDGRGGQMEFLATLAARHGYKLNVFAPGRDYSCTINPLDFIEDEADDTTATVLAEVFHKNLKADGGKSSDAFFSAAGQRLIQALLQFAKSTRFPDLAMAFAVARLPKLGERLQAADDRGSLPMPVQIAFSQFMQAAGAQKTASGIIATASDVLTRFMSSRILPSLLGETNVSLQLGQREMIVFQSDIFRQDAVNPILAALVTVVVNRNFSIQRQTPLVLSLDEFPTLVLPQAPTWPNEHRSKGFIGLFGFQSFPQVRERYGRERSDILLSGVGSHFWFNPGNHETAKALSQFLGDEEITIKQKSRSYSRGGSSTSTSEQTRTRPLMLPDEFLRFGTGECVVLNPAYRDRQVSNLPLHFRQVKIPREHLELVDECEELWGAEVLPALRSREEKRRPNLDLEGQLRQRFDEADRLLPMPDDEDGEASQTGKTAGHNVPGL